jgi:hypothetical protein
MLNLSYQTLFPLQFHWVGWLPLCHL